jgi:hypothetical protein
MARIFISHSSHDESQAQRLLSWLRSGGFTDAFLDFDKHAGIEPGAGWERKLYSELSRAEAVILVLTKNWFDSKWCFVEFAQARALGSHSKNILSSRSAPNAGATSSWARREWRDLRSRRGWSLRQSKMRRRAMPCLCSLLPCASSTSVSRRQAS